MAPSRGTLLHLSLRARSAPVCTPPKYTRYTKKLSSLATAFAAAATHPSSNRQIYVSRSLDPYLNLSIEHFLLQKSPANSTVLFLYKNRPCVVIGRNQNPWVEVNLAALGRHGVAVDENERAKGIDLVRRRSGGGTVFHDTGNVNYSVICPSRHFQRDKHAEMVVSALRGLGVDRARVNERHDIVMDEGPAVGNRIDPSNLHQTPYTSKAPAADTPRKVSGSAYKLTRERSLHHGTCLLSSPNLRRIHEILDSPARSYIRARGVESVRSPVRNVGLAPHVFIAGVINEFCRMYGIRADAASEIKESMQGLHHGEGFVGGYVGHDVEDVEEVKKGMAELKSADWIYGQTPQFTLYSHPPATEASTGQSPSSLHEETQLELIVRSGAISEFSLLPSSSPRETLSQLHNLKIYDPSLNWTDLLLNRAGLPIAQSHDLGAWLSRVLPPRVAWMGTVHARVE